MIVTTRQLSGEGAVAHLMRDIDWRTFALGDIAAWPDVLVDALNLILNAPVPMHLFWGPDLFCFYNDAMAELLNSKHPVALGKPALEVWAEAWEVVGPQLEAVYRQGKVVHLQNVPVPVLVSGTMTDRYWSHSYSPVFDREGQIVGVLNVAQDSTGPVLAAQAERARKASEQRLAAFTRAAQHVFFQTNADWSLMLQLNGQNVLGDTGTADPDWLGTYVYPEDQPAVRRTLAKAIRSQGIFQMEHRVRRVDGTVGWTLSRAVPVLGPDASISEWFGTATDITELKKVETELRAGREQLRLALDAASLCSWFYDFERKVVGGDVPMGELFGLDITEGPAEIWLGAIVEADRERVGREFAAALQGAPYDTEYRVLVAGEIRWIRARASLSKHLGEVWLFGICENITEQKSAEFKLRSTVERLALAEQVGNIAAWEWDLRTGTLSWDAAGTWVYGRSPAEVSRIEDVQRFIHSEDVDRVMRDVTPALEGRQEFNSDFRVCWPDGSVHWLLGKGKPTFDDHGVVTRLNGVNIDVTERRAAESALRVAEKLAAVGQLSSTIAHEINNPLESVTNLLYICKTSTQDPSLLEYLEVAETELRRMAVITNQTLRFHKQLSGPSEITCFDLFSNSLLIYEGRIRNAGIRVEKRKRAERPVTCLEGEIRQVMNNLIGNAIDAMKQGGGRLLVRSGESTDWRTGRQGLRLTIADTGSGMTRETQRRLYEPFYTTKGIGGTGLGLLISREIVDRHKGRLTIRSSQRPGHSGTVFNLFLPFESAVGKLTRQL